MYRRVRGWWLVGLFVGMGLAWLPWQVGKLRVWYAARQFRQADEPQRRLYRAEQLVQLGPAGRLRLQQIVAQADTLDPASWEAFRKHLAGAADGPGPLAVLAAMWEGWPQYPDAVQEALLRDLLPKSLQHNELQQCCREAVAAALRSPAVMVRRAAAPWATHPQLQLTQELMPLLEDAEASVRRAALFAVVTAEDAVRLLPDEELFRWLHDPDAGVRRICYDALVARQRSEADIDLGRRLTHPAPVERLKLLADLRYDDLVPDPEPWLYLLAQDREPAVRVGAVRVVAELRAARRVDCPAWVGAAVNREPDPTVRRIMLYYQQLPQQRWTGGVRPAGGP